jgi:hypothetical protein
MSKLVKDRDKHHANGKEESTGFIQRFDRVSYY